MDEQSKAKLDAILAIEPAALTDEDKVFLRARSSYLTVPQREVYAEVLSAPLMEAEREATDREVEAGVFQSELSEPIEAPKVPAEDTTPKSKKASKKASVTE